MKKLITLNEKYDDDGHDDGDNIDNDNDDGNTHRCEILWAKPRLRMMMMTTIMIMVMIIIMMMMGIPLGVQSCGQSPG